VKPRLSKPDDARAVKSRKALQQALLTLISAKPFEQIAIKDITTEAGVSYPTFFRQFSSKEHLLEYIAGEEIRQLFLLSQPVFETQTPQASIRIQCEYVAARRELWSTLLTEGAAAVMREGFARIAVEMGYEREITGKLSNPWLPRELAASFVVSGLFEVLSWWLRQPENYPVDNVVIFMEQLIVNPTMVPRDIQLVEMLATPKS
jgi:AcrR family transcriptional regulator